MTLEFEFEDILPFVEGGGDTGKTAREKIKRNFDKLKPLGEIPAEVQQVKTDLGGKLNRFMEGVSSEEEIETTSMNYGFYYSTKYIKIQGVTSYGFYIIQVQAGKKYKVSAKIKARYTDYKLILFSETLLEENSTASILKSYEGEDGVLTTVEYDFEYIPISDGYLYFYSQELAQTTITFYLVRELSVSEFVQQELQNNDNTAQIKQDIHDVNERLDFIQDGLVEDVNINGGVVQKGYYQISNSRFYVVSDSYTYGFVYIPVESGKKYTIHAKIRAKYQEYALILFSANVLQNGNLATVLKSFEGTDNVEQTLEYSFDFIPEENGYLYQYTQNFNVSIIAFSVSNPVGVAEYVDIKMNREDTSDKRLFVPDVKKNIICSGSSITWGKGAIDDSFVGEVDKYIKSSLSSFLDFSELTYSSEPELITNSLLYGGKANMITGVGGKISFDIYCDELAICQMIRRTGSDYAIFTIKADGVICGTFDNKNTVKHNSESFSGENLSRIRLSHPCTFNHTITVNGSTTINNVVINTGDYGATIPDNCEAWVFRGLDDNGQPVHYIQFASSLGTITSVNVSYDYGKIIAHERSTVGQTSNEFVNESRYGLGTVSYDPARPVSGVGSGIEFRAIDERAFIICKFNEFKLRHIDIEIIGGSSPYLIINYVTNRYHNLMNAGIGGWKLSLMLDNNKICDYQQLFKWFMPDLLFQESCTNDDWDYPIRRISRDIGELTLNELCKMPTLEVHTVTYNPQTGNYNVSMCTGIISSITPTSLTSSDIIGTSTQIGDIVRIGTYHGDNHECVTRRITDVNLETGEIKWTLPINAENILNIESISDLVGAEINIRNLDSYKQKYQEFIDKIRIVSPNTKIVIVGNGLTIYWLRQLWGYDIIHKELCNENYNVYYCDIEEWIYEHLNGTISGRNNSMKQIIESTGALVYELSFTQNHKSWQGFKVLVDGVDVYGKDCYIESSYRWHPKTSVSGTSQDFSNPYNKKGTDSDVGAMKLVFYKNIPASGITIEIQFAEGTWSADYCHPNILGSYLYGQKYKHFL